MHDFPGVTVRLKRDVEEVAEDHIRLAEMAIGALYTFSEGLCLPLSMEITAAYWDDEFDLPLPSPRPRREHGMLRRRRLPERLYANSRYRNELPTLAEEFDAVTAASFIKGFLSSDDSDEPAVGWEDLAFNATAARLPDDDGRHERSSIRIEVAGHHLDHPIERHAGSDWIYGPIGASILHAPFEFQVQRDQGEMVFDVTIYWSTWSPGGPGWADVEKGMAALTEDGWVQD